MDDVVKQRHGCLTVWLILMMVLNGLTAVATPLILLGSRQANFPSWAIAAITLMAILNVVFAIALFKWKKWGFFGFFVSSLVILCLNLYLGVGAQSFVGLLGIVVLYAVLQIGGEKKGWSQLE